MRQVIVALVNDKNAASAAEYALVAALIGVVLIAGLELFGNTLSRLFNYVGSEVSNITPSA